MNVSKRQGFISVFQILHSQCGSEIALVHICYPLYWLTLEASKNMCNCEPDFFVASLKLVSYVLTGRLFVIAGIEQNRKSITLLTTMVLANFSVVFLSHSFSLLNIIL